MVKIGREYRFYSKLLLSLAILTMGLFLFISIYQAYHRKIDDAEAYTLEKLHSIAKTLSVGVDGDIHQQLVCTYKKKDAIKVANDDENYEKIHRLLESTQDINELQTPVYTMFYDVNCKGEVLGDILLFGVSSDEPVYRHIYESPVKSHKESFEEGGIIDEYYDKHGHWLSAFAPIKNSKGEVVAIVQADESFCGFVVDARKLAIKDSLFALGVLSLLGLGFIYIYRLVISMMNEINDSLDLAVKRKTVALEETNQALNELNEQLEKKVAQRTQALQTANEDFAESNDKLQAFARIASHDLRAPLRVMIGFANLLEKKYGPSLDDEGREYINFITTTSRKMSDLVSGILKTSLLQYQNDKILEEVNLNKIVEEVRSNLQDEIDRLNASIKYCELPTVKGHRTDFIQLFQNFISNALKYKKPDVKPHINIFSKPLNEGYELTIKDNGRGITSDAIQSIFKEFDRGNAKDNKGYGIGLATCKRIIKSYRGTLDVESTVNVGSTFIFTVRNRV